MNLRFNECHQHLEKAEDFIIELQESLNRASSQPIQSESILYESLPVESDLEAVHDEYRRKIVTISHEFETTITALHQENHGLKAHIESLNKNISDLQQEVYRLESSQTSFV